MSLNPRGVALHFAYRFAILAFIFVLFGGMQILHAQTTLSEGDIAFTYVQDGEKYSFVLLRDVDFGTQLVVMSNGSIITGWIAPVGGASAGDVITVETSDAKEEGVVAFYGGASCAYTGLAEISPKGFDQTDDECGLSSGQSIEWNNKKTVVYTGARSGYTAGEFLAEFNDDNNWSVYSGNSTDYDNTSSFTIDDNSGSNQNSAVTSIYTQDFQTYSTYVTTPSDGAWTLSTPSNADLWATASPGGGQIVFAGIDTDGNATWTSEDISISGYTGIELAIDLYESGNQDSDDNIDVSVIVDGTTTSLYSVNDDFNTTSQSGLSVGTGSTLNVKVTVNNDKNNQQHFFDNISVTGTLSCSAAISSVAGSTVVLDGSGSGTVTASSSNVTATDGCGTGLAYYVSTSASGPFNSSTVDVDCTDIGSLTLYFQVADGSGNTSNVESASFTISDNTAPSTPSVSVSDIAIESDGTTTISAATYASGSTDNCSAQGVTYLVSTNGTSGFATTLDVTCSDLGALTLYFRAEDSSGNQSSSTLAGNGAFTVVDNIGPTITAVTPTSVDLTDGAATLDVSSLTFTASDNCTSSGSLTYTVSSSSGGSFGSSVALDCTDIPSTTLYFKATDASGNASAEFSQAFSVSDATAPTISSTSGATVNLDGAGSVTVTASSTYVTATDDCTSSGALTYLVSDATDGTYAGTINLGCSDVGSKTLYFKVQDAAGNLSTASSASFTVADVTAPTVTASDQSLDLTGSSVTLLASTVVSSSADNCSVTATEIKLTSAGEGAYASSIDFTSGGTYSVTVRVSDASGNTGTATATVTVTEVLYSEDFEDFPNNYGFGANGSSSEGYPNDVDQDWTISGSPSDNWWVDLMSGNKLFEGKDLDGECVWTSPTIDVSGKTTLNLTMDLSEDAGQDDLEDEDYIRVYVKYNGGSETLLLGTSNDYDAVTLDQSLSDATNIQFVVRANNNGNGEHHRFDNVRLTGVQGCTAIAVSALPVTVDLASNGEVAVTWSTVSASSTGDCFTVSSYEVSKDGGSYGASVTYDCTETGAQTLYVRATDGSSTSDPTTVTVTVQDVTAPTIASVSGGSIVLDANGDATITASTTYVSGAADNCSGQGLTYLVSDASDGTYAATLALTCSDLSGKDVYFKVQDASGNLSAAAGPASFTVTDNTAPTYTTTGGTFNLSGGSVSVTFADVTTGLTDVCDASPTTEVSKNNSTWLSSVSYDCTDAGTSPTLYVRATDASGNVNQTSVSISIADNMAPVITAVSPTSVQLSTSAATVSISGLTITASDDCTSSGALTYTVSTASAGTYGTSVDFDCTDIGTVPLYFKAQDATGNLSAAFEQDFTVTDATGLTATGQNITVDLDASGSYTLTASEVDNGSVGNCNTSLSVSPSVFDCNNIGSNEVTLTITDSSSGATNSTTATVTVQDVTMPNATQITGGTLSKNLNGTGSGTILPGDVYIPGNPIDRCTADEDLVIQIKRVGGAWGSSVAVDCNDVGTPFTVDVRIEDEAENEWLMSANGNGAVTVTINDTTDPIIGSVTSGQTQILSSAGTATIAASFYTTASDNCTASGSLTYEISELSGSGFASTFAADCNDIGAKTFYFRVKDASGNPSPVISETITIADNTAPTAVANDRTIPLSGASTVTLQADDATFNTSTDNCSLTSEIKLTSAGDGTFDSSYEFPGAGSYDVTLRVTDAGGNTATDNATITVIAEPDDIVIYFEDFENDPINFQFAEGAGQESVDGKWTVDDLGTGYASLFPSIESCNTGITYSLDIEFTRDFYGSEFSWSLANSSGGTEDSGGTYSDGCTNVVFTSSNTLSGGVYTLTLNDSFGDGWGVYTNYNCNNPPEVTVTVDGVLITTITPGNFGSSVSYDIPVGCVNDNDNIFEVQQGSAIDWFSREIDISAFQYVDISVDVSENGDADNEGFVLSTLIDGGAATAQLTDTDGDFDGTRSVTSITGDVLIVKLEAQTGTDGEIGFDNITVTGYCIDLDGNDICDSEQDCVETAGKDCGCMDKTACTYEADATDASADSCFYPGMPFQGAACGSAGQFVYYDADCSCASENWTSAYSENFNDEENYDGFFNTNFQDVSGNDSPSADGWSINVGSPSTIYLFGARDYGDNLGRMFVSRGNSGVTTWSAADSDVAGSAYVKATLDILHDGAIEIEEEIRVYHVEDGTRRADDFGNIKGGGVDGDYSDFKNLLGIAFVDDATQWGLDVVCDMTDEANDDSEFLQFDNIVLEKAGEQGCMAPGAGGYSASATYDDGSCTWSNVTLYSRYDGGFEDKLWENAPCSGANGVCGSAPFPNARQVDANTQTSATTINYVISSGTTVTVNGATNVDDDPTTKDLFVKDLTIESGGALVIPAGKRLRVMGTYTDNNGNGVSGAGMLCIDGEFIIATGEGTPAVVTVQDFLLPEGSSVTVPAGKTLSIQGDLAFDDAAPTAVSGLVELAGTVAQSISGDGATLDDLNITNTAGVTASDTLKIQGQLTLGSSSSLTMGDLLEIQDRLTLSASSTLAMGSNKLSFSSDSVSGSLGTEKTAVLDAIPATASITGPAGRAMQSSNTDPTAEVERFIGPDSDGTTNWGYTMYGTSISGATVSDFNGTADFYSAGWPGSDYPSSTSTISFWNESTGSIEYANSSSTSLTDRGCWVLLYGTQSPTMKTEGTLNDHKLGGSSKTFSVTRQGPVSASAGWNMVYNPYQARLDWDAVIDGNSNSAVIEDQFLIFDTQDRRFRRYGKTNSDVQWSNDTEAGEDSIAMQYVNPGQGFWVRVKDGVSSGTVTLDPSMIDNDGSAVGFIRNAEEGVLEVLLEVENDNGATRMVLRFGADGSAEEYRDGDMSYLGSSTQLGESAVVIGDQKYVAKRLPLEAFDGELFVRSRANMASAIRVVEVLGVPGICAHIEDHVTGEVMVLEEGAELAFTLPAHQAEEGRFTLHSVPFGSVEGRSPDCPNSEAGTIVMELGDAVADVTVTNYETMEVAAALYQETGTVEVPMAPGEYAVMVDAYEGTSLCRGGRRQVVIAPGEQPELLGVEALPSDCNAGMASLEFELYGSGDYQTELMQGNTSVWSETLPAGEHTLEGIDPGEYILTVQHACLEAYEFVSLLDDDEVNVEAEYVGFVQAESNGGAWLEAACPVCETGIGIGYTWLLDGEEVMSDHPLEVRVEQMGTYSLELVTYGFECDASESFEITVGKYLEVRATDLEWLGVHAGHLGVRFTEEWSGVAYNWYDATGRCVEKGQMGSAAGEVFVAVPNARGWMVLEIRSARGETARWTGILD